MTSQRYTPEFKDEVVRQIIRFQQFARQAIVKVSIEFGHDPASMLSLRAVTPLVVS